MKITTDACIQGAWTPVLPDVKQVLDIGTGTGLLSLMLAQRHPGIRVDAIEYDKEAAIQAAGNIAASPWHRQITVIQGDIRNYQPTAKYDLIICNPPFFTGSLLSDNPMKNHARHDVALNKYELLDAVTANLAEDGYLSLLLPHSEYLLWKGPAAKHQLHESCRLLIQHRPAAPVKRVVAIMTKGEELPSVTQTLTIGDEGGGYSADFRKLLGDYYLNL